MASNHSDFSLGEWVVRPQRCRIERGDKVIRVKPKSMAVLERLAANGNEVTTRNELFDAVWPGAAVTDDVLTHSIVELRKAFGDTARDASVIETIPKKGFRLMLPVTPLRERAVASRPIAFWVGVATVLLILAVLAVQQFRKSMDPVQAGETTPSVAVLPFVDMSPAKDQGYFADGLSEELINRLTQLRGLQVTGRTSSFYFKDKNVDLRSIGGRLGVSHVLEGSVRKNDTRLRITAQLIDVSNGFHLWSDVFDRPGNDLFVVQEEIAEAVAQALSIKLSVGMLGNLVGGTSNVEAYEEVLLGRSLHSNFSAESLLQAAEHYARAAEIDPDFALAWSLQAGVLRNTRLVLSEQEFEQGLNAADSALTRALSLAPQSPYILRTAAQKDIDDALWAEAEAKLALAEEYDNSLVSRSSGTRTDFLSKTGKISDAIFSIERARRIEPLDAGVAMYLGHLYAAQGDLAKGLAELERGYGLGQSRALISVEGLVNSLAVRDPGTIRHWLQRAIEHQQPGAMGVHTSMLELLDDRDAALRWLQAAYVGKSIPDYYVGVWASYYDDTTLAANALQRSADAWLFWLPIMQGVRQRPEFKRVMAEVGLLDYWREHGWPDLCHPIGATDFACD